MCAVYIIVAVLLTINGFLLVILDVYNMKDKQKNRPLKGFVQVLQVLLFFIGGIIVVSVLIGKSPMTLFAGLGASAAVLMLVFKDSILGFVDEDSRQNMYQMVYHPAFHQQRIPLMGRAPGIMLHTANEDCLAQIVQPYRKPHHQQCNNRLVKHLYLWIVIQTRHFKKKRAYDEYRRMDE